MTGLTTAAINGLRELWAHRTRSLLSMSGIILGVAVLATMLAAAEGMLGNFREFVATQGGIERIAIVRAELPVEQAHLAGTSEGLTLRDIETVRQSVPLAEHLSPEVELGTVRVGRNGRETNARLLGAAPGYIEVNRRELAQGRFLTDLDDTTRAKVCVIGDTLVQKFFPNDESALGQTLIVNGVNHTVVGVFKNFSPGAKAGDATRRLNATVCIPLRTGAARVSGNSRLSSLNLRVSDPRQLREVSDQVETLLLRTHRGLREFRIETNETTLAEFQKTEKSFVLALGGVAVIALLVGGAGIMNVMLASINERTREIGVRLAIGARPSDVFLQFIIESVMVGVFGGLIGIACSMGLSTWLAEFINRNAGTNNVMLVTHNVLAAGLAFSCGIGLLAGVYPALRAARLNPIEALRGE